MLLKWGFLLHVLMDFNLKNVFKNNFLTLLMILTLKFKFSSKIDDFEELIDLMVGSNP